MKISFTLIPKQSLDNRYNNNNFKDVVGILKNVVLVSRRWFYLKQVSVRVISMEARLLNRGWRLMRYISEIGTCGSHCESGS